MNNKTSEYAMRVRIFAQGTYDELWAMESDLPGTPFAGSTQTNQEYLHQVKIDKPFLDASVWIFCEITGQYLQINIMDKNHKHSIGVTIIDAMNLLQRGGNSQFDLTDILSPPGIYTWEFPTGFYTDLSSVGVSPGALEVAKFYLVYTEKI